MILGNNKSCEVMGIGTVRIMMEFKEFFNKLDIFQV